MVMSRRLCQQGWRGRPAILPITAGGVLSCCAGGHGGGSSMRTSSMVGLAVYEERQLMAKAISSQVALARNCNSCNNCAK